MTVELTSLKNSYSIIIRDAIINRLRNAVYFESFKRFSRSKQQQVQEQNLPYCGVYIVDETLTPDGDINVGEIRFIHALRIGFSIIIKNNNPDETEDLLDAAFWSIMCTLMLDANFTNLLESDMPDNTRIEGFTRGMRRNSYGNAALNNELPTGELQFDLTCSYRTRWPPVITDDLLVIHMKTGFPFGSTPEEQAAIQQVEAEYDLSVEPPDPTDPYDLTAKPRPTGP